jgi:hypothetical protein
MGKKKKLKQGWICPLCGKVNNPENKTCINECRVILPPVKHIPDTAKPVYPPWTITVYSCPGNW